MENPVEQQNNQINKTKTNQPQQQNYTHKPKPTNQTSAASNSNINPFHTGCLKIEVQCSRLCGFVNV